LTENLAAFDNCGIDYAGPFKLKVGQRKVRKVIYILVITCLATRAVHLEPTEGMTTDDVIMALSRFCDVRTTPTSITSDNQTSFHKTDRDLHYWIQTLNFGKLVKETGLGFKPRSFGIKWYFNPPYAPHMGGIYETIVKATKRALHAVTKDADLVESQFRTLVYDIMARLNDRPIALKGDPTSDLPPLTPNHFLMTKLGGAQLLPPFDLNQHSYTNIKTRWQQVQLVQEHFWSRFVKEIVPLLGTRAKWTREQENIKEGDIVVEIAPDSPKQMWKTFQVAQVFPSKDGKIRRVEVRGTKKRHYNKAVQNLIPIVVD